MQVHLADCNTFRRARYIAVVQAPTYTLVVRLADLIRDEREKRGWNKRRLAKEAGVDPSTITRIENGETMTGRGGTSAKIAKALGIPAPVLDAAIREAEEESEVQYIDLSGIPSERRRDLRRYIDALVRESRRKGED